MEAAAGPDKNGHVWGGGGEIELKALQFQLGLLTKEFPNSKSEITSGDVPQRSNIKLHKYQWLPKDQIYSYIRLCAP